MLLSSQLCSLVSLQRYTKALTTLQRASLVEESRQKPPERMRVLSDGLKTSDYGSEPMLRNCGISVTPEFTKVDGRVLQAPRLKFGNDEYLNPRNGRWNFNNKKIEDPVKLERWAVVNFSARCDVRRLVMDLIRIGRMKGILVEQPEDVIEENAQFRRAPPVVRVEKMFADIKSKLSPKLCFILCLLPERKNSDLYGPWKKKNLAEVGIVTQCIAPTRVNDHYVTNVLLKINAKLGGMNSLLGVEHSRSIPIVSKAPTLILGMDVSHGSPGQSEIPSIAAVVSSRQWPLISKYRACVRSQGSKVEMIDNLFKPVFDKEDEGTIKDEGIIRELLLDFFHSSGERLPDNIIIFRDGVSESQFNQVLNVELSQIIEACKFLDETWNPKFMVIVAQKNHHTKFFQPRSPDNVPPGTVVDSKICHPTNYDFYMCAHAGMITDPNWGNFLYNEATKTINLIDFGAARDFPKSFVDDYLRMVLACANGDNNGVIEMSKRLGFLTGMESDVMLDAHVQAGFIVGLPFSKPGPYDFRSTNITQSISHLGATMLKHRLTPPPDEAYSLHRKLSGAFLACIKIGAVVPCRELLLDMYKHHKFGEVNDDLLSSGSVST